MPSREGRSAMKCLSCGWYRGSAVVGMGFCFAAGIVLIGMGQQWWAVIPMVLAILFAGMAMHRDKSKEGS